MAAGIAAVLLKTNVHSRAFPNPKVCCLSHKLVSEPDAAAENKHVLLLTKELVRRSRKKTLSGNLVTISGINKCPKSIEDNVVTKMCGLVRNLVQRKLCHSGAQNNSSEE